MDPQSFHKPPNLGLISCVMHRHKLALNSTVTSSNSNGNSNSTPLLFVGVNDKIESPVSAFPSQAGFNFMKADIFFGKSGWSISSKLYVTRGPE